MYVQPTQDALERGLYLVTMAIEKKPGTHYGILDIGNVLMRAGVFAPTIYHLMPAGPIATTDLSGIASAERVTDERGAVTRFAQALTKPVYEVFTNNCEHFARFIAFGERSSSQAKLLGLAGVVGLVGLAVALSD